MEKKSSGQRGRIQEGQVRVPLEGELDLAGLSRDLRARGFFLANDPEAMDSQGWGEDYDPEGYYPYWVFRDGKRWVFACPPKTSSRGPGGGGNTPSAPGPKKYCNPGCPMYKNGAAEESPSAAEGKSIRGGGALLLDHRRPRSGDHKHVPALPQHFVVNIHSDYGVGVQFGGPLGHLFKGLLPGFN